MSRPPSQGQAPHGNCLRAPVGRDAPPPPSGQWPRGPAPPRRVPSLLGRVPECPRRSAGRGVVATGGKLAVPGPLSRRLRARGSRSGRWPAASRAERDSESAGAHGGQGRHWVRGAGEEPTSSSPQRGLHEPQPAPGVARGVCPDWRGGWGGRRQAPAAELLQPPRRPRVTPGRGLAQERQPPGAVVPGAMTVLKGDNCSEQPPSLCEPGPGPIQQSEPSR